MNKKISEMMDNLDIKYLESYDEGELYGGNEEREALLDTDKKLNEMPSLDVIKRRALEGIKITSIESHREAKKEKKSRLKGKKHILLPLVAVFTALGMSVVAVSNSPVLSSLIGDQFAMIHKEAQVVGQSVNHQGIIFTVEEAVIDSSSGFIALSMTKENGEPFDENTLVENIRIQPAKHTSMGYAYESILSEDKKKLYYLIDINMNKNLYGQEITIVAENIGHFESEEIPLEVDLQEVYHKMQELDYNYYEDMDYEKDQTLNVPLTDKLEGFMLDQMILDHKGTLRLYTSYPDPYEENHLDTRFKLIDSKLDLEVYYQEGTNRWDEDTQRRRIKDVFGSITEEDLKDLKLQLAYENYTPIVRDEWSLTFKLSKNSNVKKARPNRVVESEQGSKIKVKNVEVSSLGVRVDGYQLEGSVGVFDLSLKMKDGQILKLSTSGLSTSANYFFTEHLKLALIEEANPTHTPTSYSDHDPYTESISHTMGLSANDFIDLNEVQSLIIENTEIPLH